MTNPTITVSFQPIKIKFFRSKKKSLLVIDGSCINGSRNRIRPGDKALIHVRQSTSFPSANAANISGIENLANALLAEEDPEKEIITLHKGCWVDVKPTKKR